MFRQIFGSAVLAALAAGVLGFVLQHALTTPLILQAEVYESGGAAPGAAHEPGHDHGAATASEAVDDGHGHDHGEGWAPADGLERSAYTALTALLAGFGWALLLVALMALHGGTIDARRGMLWGIAGFAATALAPGLGLPPELPGSMAAELGDRQLWWLGTVAATAAGLWLVLLGAGWPRVLGGLALIALPHLVGAPHPAAFGGSAPPELAGHFATASLAVSAVFWLVLGLVAGASFARLDAGEASASVRGAQPA